MEEDIPSRRERLGKCLGVQTWDSVQLSCEHRANSRSSLELSSRQSSRPSVEERSGDLLQHPVKNHLRTFLHEKKMNTAPWGRNPRKMTWTVAR